jgi:hypothetical protein
MVFVLLLLPGASYSAPAREVLADSMVGHARMSLAAGRISEGLEAADIALFLAGRDDDERLLLECRARARELIERMAVEAGDARKAGDAGGAEHVGKMIETLRRSAGDG